MITVYKYALNKADDTVVDTYIGAEILCVQLQHGVPCVWVKVDNSLKTTTRRFRWRGTGHNAEDVGTYVGTVQVMGGSLISHLFVDPEVL